MEKSKFVPSAIHSFAQCLTLQIPIKSKVIRQKSHHSGLDLGTKGQLVSTRPHLLPGSPGCTRLQHCHTAWRAKPGTDADCLCT